MNIVQTNMSKIQRVFVKKMVKVSLAAAIGLLCFASAFAQSPKQEKKVRETIESFYAAFNSHGFERSADFTTEDWNHINPFGGRTRGREAVLKELREVHSTFLKGVSDTIREIDVRFADSGAAVVTVTSQMSNYTTPDKITHENERHIRTFIVVKRKGHWLIMQDQNTIIG